MNKAVNVEDLNAALLTRAKTLADEILARAKRERERVIEDASTRLHLREERETAVAIALGERTFRQLVQASEIEMRENLDRARWVHVQAVMDAMKDRLATLVGNEAEYLPLLEKLLVKAAVGIESDELVAQLSARDFAHLSGRWESFAGKAVPDKRVALSPETLHTMGGVLVSSADNRIRIDNTFEGRIERLEVDLGRAITERLFASATPMGALFHG
jgi:V/A-type H+-transporting ATPase subunit E